MLSLALALLVGAAPTEPVRVALDLTGLDEPTFAAIDGLAIEQSAVTRLVQEGFAVVGRDRGPDLVVSVTASSERVRLAIAEAKAREIPRAAGVERGELVLEVVQKLVELVRAEAAGLPPRAPSPSAPPPPPAKTATLTATATASEPTKQGIPVELGLRGGLVLRAGGVDPIAFGWMRLGGRLGLRGELGATLSIDPAIVTQDGFASVGPSLRQTLAPGLELDVGLLAGLHLHSYQLQAAVSDKSGVRLDVEGYLLVDLSYRLRPWLGLGAFAQPGLSSSDRQHTLGDQVIWRRSFWFVIAGLGVAVEL
ncbi:MAG: hypothetical protein U1E65_20895 [Myxococcota bacterium]